MPLYEYKCNDCGFQFEELRNIADMNQPIKCPKCGLEDVKKQLSTFGVKGNTSEPPCKTPACGGRCKL